MLSPGSSSLTAKLLSKRAKVLVEEGVDAAPLPPDLNEAN
jgi:hypothetical protein